MYLAKVVGTVWSTSEDENLFVATFFIFRQLDLNYKEKEHFIAAIDSIGAEQGEVVLVATGNSSIQTKFTKIKPVDAVIITIVEKNDISLEEYLKKQEAEQPCKTG